MKNRKEDRLSDAQVYEYVPAGNEWSWESDEDRRLTEKIRREIMDSAEREEAMLQNRPDLKDIGPSLDLFDKIMSEAKKMERAKEAESVKETESTKDEESTMPPGSAEKAAEYDPEKYLNEEDRKALEIGRRKLRSGRKGGWRHHFTATAAVLACVFIVGVSTEANRAKIVNVLNTWIGEDALVRVDNETNREQVSNDLEEVYADIEEQLGIKPVRFMYELKGMDFNGYEVDEITQRAVLFYTYQDTIMTIAMTKDDNGTSKGSIKDGEMGDTFSVQTDIGDVTVLTIDEEMGEKYMTEFVYENAYYSILAELPKEEFVNLVSSIFF